MPEFFNILTKAVYCLKGLLKFLQQQEAPCPELCLREIMLATYSTNWQRGDPGAENSVRTLDFFS